MLIRTHLLITLFFVLFFLNLVNHKIAFVIVSLIVTFIPDLDTKYSRLGKFSIVRPLQWISRHRGIFHSFLFLIVLTLFFVLFFPVIALPFFLGYGLHLFADSFTIEGIIPFYPFGKRISGKIRTGGKKEITLMFVFVILNLLLLVKWGLSVV